LLAITGLIAIVLNFTVVNLYVQGLHSYSGLK
jgi:ABC-type transport system involved in cytochrome c biogenesis permease subunit